MSLWSLVYKKFVPEEEGVREALCALGNGYFVTRGAACFARADGVHYPGTYLAGGYNRLTTEIAGRAVENEDLVNMPNWLCLTFRIEGGEWFDMREVRLHDYRQELDLKQGVLHRKVRFEDGEGRITYLHEERFVHIDDPHVAGLRLQILPENWSGTLEVRSTVDAGVINAGVARYRELASRHLELINHGELDEDAVHLEVRTTQSRLEAALAMRTHVYRDRERVHPARAYLSDEARIGHAFTLEAHRRSPLFVEKLVTLYTSRDRAIAEAGLAAQTHLRRLGSFDEHFEHHRRTWRHLWRQFDMEMDCTTTSIALHPTMVLRLHIFHLLQTVSPNSRDLDVGVPARGWHGEAYRGHIFWDELFIFPLLNLRMPEITRSLLHYRYRRLGAACRAASEAGHRGAMYPWQSGSDGREETQTLHLNPRSGRWLPDHTHLQRHVSADIAFNVWQYYQVTADQEFMLFYGAEMILQIARFFDSLTTYDAEHARYEILGVMGPDEYHDTYPGSDRPGLDNNAYTNVMAVWVLTRALEVLDMLPELRGDELLDELEIRPEEIARWRDISHRMRLCFHDEGIISQFEGYERLEEFDWQGYRERYGDIQRLDRILEAEGDTPNRYRLSKQADVLMLFYLFTREELAEIFERLGYPFDEALVARNVAYYLARTSHGSTLSRVVHSWVLADTDRNHSWELFNQALMSDVADIQGGTTAEGIHLGAMAGTVDLVQRSFVGIETHSDVLWFNPRLPPEVRCLHQDLRYRGHSLTLTITPERMTVIVRPGGVNPIRIGFRGQIHDIAPNGMQEFQFP